MRCVGGWVGPWPCLEGGHQEGTYLVCVDRIVLTLSKVGHLHLFGLRLRYLDFVPILTDKR